jgi:uncharacterized membrane protein
MREYVVFALLAGAAWGVGGYFEKAGLRALGLAPIAGIALRTAVALVLLGALSLPAWKQVPRGGDPTAWIQIVVFGGVVAGTIGMWAFYRSLATTDNLGVTLAIAFAMSPIAGTALGLWRGTQPMDARTAVGMLAIVAGIVSLQLAQRPGR